MKRLKDSGDTIIEVMLALVVASFVLGGAYSMASRSLSLTRDAQERAEALKLIEGQLEDLKQLAPGGAIFADPPPKPPLFCISQGSLTKADFSVSSLPGLNADNFSTAPGGYNPACLNVHNLYNISIQYQRNTGGPSDDNLFTVQARWDRLGGGRDEVSLEYRLHP